MAKTNRSHALENRTQRSRIKTGNRVAVAVGDGLALLYRRGADGVGTWQGRRWNGRSYLFSALGEADDMRPADGADVLDYWQAFERTRAWAKEAAGRIAGEPVFTPGRGTVGEACEAYLADFIKRGGKAVTYTRDTIERVIRPELGHLRLEQLTPAHVRRWLQNIAGRGRGLRSKRGQETTRLAAPTDPDEVRARRSTANRNYTVLRAALNHAYREGMVASDDAWRRVRPFQKVDEARVRYLTTAEASRLVVACPLELRRLVRAALLTGARFGELAALHVADFNADTQQIRMAPAKSGRARHVSLNAEGVKFFKSIVAGRPGDALILTRDNGKAWDRHDYLPAMAEACAEAKITPACTLHELRHTYASLLAQAGADLLTISKLLGHSDTRITSRHYAHLCDRTLANAVQTKLPSFGALPARKSKVVELEPAARRAR